MCISFYRSFLGLALPCLVLHVLALLCLALLGYAFACAFWKPREAKEGPKACQKNAKRRQRDAKGRPRARQGGQGEAKGGQREAKGRLRGGQGAAKRDQGRPGQARRPNRAKADQGYTFFGTKKGTIFEGETDQKSSQSREGDFLKMSVSPRRRAHFQR